MKLSYNITIPLGLLFLIILSTSCKKFLDEKPDTKLSVPTTLADARALLEYNPVMSSNATADEVSADNYYLTQQHYNSMEEEGHKRMYT